MTESKVDEQSAFEKWLERTRPSGDVESVQRQWEESYDFQDFLEDAALAACTPAKSEGR